MNKSIFISGTGGQGVKLMSFVLSKIISNMNYNVSLGFDYDAAMRGGTIVSFLKYSDGIIDNPIIEDADIHLKLSEGGNIAAKKVICQTGTCDGEQIDFKAIATKEFENVMVINMIGIGVILKSLDIDLNKISLESVLPDQNREQNIEAIKRGYNLR